MNKIYKMTDTKNGISIFIFLCLTVLSIVAEGQTYLSENFDSPFVGSPAAPSGWTQTRVVNTGYGVPVTIGAGEKDWTQNVNTGTATWAITPLSIGTVPNAAVSGTGVLYINDANFFNANNNSRRMVSPVINLSGSTTPYVRFKLFFAAASSAAPIKVMASNDGGATFKRYN
jgi:hypothetical protein